MNALITASNIMKFAYKKVTDKWLLRAIRDFSEIYEGCPDKKDIDVFAEFIQKENVLSNKDDLASIQAIPEEVREALSLRFDRNLKPFVAEYKQGFAPLEEAAAPDR